MSKPIQLIGFENNENEMLKLKKLDIYISNDKVGKTLSISNGKTMFTIPFEPIAEYLK